MTTVRVTIDVAGILTAVVSLVVSVAALRRVRRVARALDRAVRGDRVERETL